MDKIVFNRLVERVPNLRVLSPSRTYFDPYEQEVVCEFETVDDYITLKELKDDLETMSFYRNLPSNTEFLLIKDGVGSYINKITHPEDRHLL